MKRSSKKPSEKEMLHDFIEVTLIASKEALKRLEALEEKVALLESKVNALDIRRDAVEDLVRSFTQFFDLLNLIWPKPKEGEEP